jgi:DNA transformation protein and related proteins
MSDTPLHTLSGIGPTTQDRLDEIGIRTLGDLRATGSVETYRRLKFMLPRQVSLNALYALEAVLRDCHWLDLPADVKASLQQEAKAIEVAFRQGALARCAIN